MELEPKFGEIDKPSTTAKLIQGSSGARNKILSNFTTRQPLQLGTKFGQILQLDKPNTTAQLHQGSSGARAKIWSNYTQDKAYILQHSYSKAQVKLETKFCQIIHKTKSTYYNTATPRLHGARAKIWSNYTQNKHYLLQHSYSKAPVKLEPKFGQILQLDKPITTALLHQGSSGARANIWSNFTTREA